MKKFLTVAVLSLFLIGCGEAKFKASSTDEIKQSMQSMKEELPAEQFAQLQKAVLKTMFEVGSTKGSDQEKQQLFKDKLDGKTAKEIIEMAEKK
ncbi:TPA: DUF6694 family lipoprotein [Pseudomonas aeruginosa]|uniref:DUF6694 family lipoprotein n=1 Tax=Proteus TaxID=583 RepID=UPI000D696DE1|nr:MULTISPECIES: DUF6694 family lipoprotein [Proteus]MBQ0211969.1 hypothetical protein [Proteus vulgaris]MDS0789889.1 hypothetical protein [Proteus vulgaris]UPK80267.1 hypothetical protein LW139_15870 [Proteus vulgaris]